MKASWVGALTMVVLVAVVIWEVGTAEGGKISPSECKEERTLLVEACRPAIFGGSPSSTCCQRVRDMHAAECICPAVTPRLAALVRVERTIKQIEGCGRTVPHHFKCGSITTP